MWNKQIEHRNTPNPCQLSVVRLNPCPRRLPPGGRAKQSSRQRMQMKRGAESTRPARRAAAAGHICSLGGEREHGSHYTDSRHNHPPHIIGGSPDSDLRNQAPREQYDTTTWEGPRERSADEGRGRDHGPGWFRRAGGRAVEGEPRQWRRQRGRRRTRCCAACGGRARQSGAGRG